VLHRIRLDHGQRPAQQHTPPRHVNQHIQLTKTAASLALHLLCCLCCCCCAPLSRRCSRLRDMSSQGWPVGLLQLWPLASLGARTA
jgi:hypothetical protein